jgi:glycosyltransferase involved in cell wall biosynthesis
MMSNEKLKTLKVALVHDWLTGMRGGEKVLLEIAAIFPEAEIFTLLHNKGSCSREIESRIIHQSFISRLPFARKRYRNYLPFYPTAIESFDFSGYDLVISSSHCVAKGVIVPVPIPHLCYIHTPMRYAYDMFHQYFPKETTGRLKHAYISRVMTRIRTWDQATHPRVDRFAANSKFVARRVKRYYGRDADVIHPPVDTEFFTPSKAKKEDFYLIVSALEPYKRIDIAVEAFRKSGRPLVIAGGGSQLKSLRKSAPKNIKFLGKVTDEEILELYRKAQAFIFPGIEDFGITPLEAQACATPVAAYAAGGALETVIDKKTGVFFHDQTPEALNGAIDKLSEIAFNESELRKNSLRFSRRQFRERFIKFVNKHGGY